MRPGKLGRRFAVIAGIVLVLSLLAPQAAHATTSAERSSGWLINAIDRKPRGLPALGLDEYVSNIARAHSAVMARTGRLYHSNLNVVGSKIAGWRVLGENVGVGSDLGLINKAFMNSAPHRSNILCRCFKRIGIGVVYSRGYYWVTHIFYG